MLARAERVIGYTTSHSSISKRPRVQYERSLHPCTDLRCEAVAGFVAGAIRGAHFPGHHVRAVCIQQSAEGALHSRRLHLCANRLCNWRGPFRALSDVRICYGIHQPSASGGAHAPVYAVFGLRATQAAASWVIRNYLPSVLVTEPAGAS